MILINVKFRPRPEHVEEFRELVEPFTAATRNEPGNLFFDWYRSCDDTNEYILVEAFTDDGAEPHVNSEHFRQAQQDFPGWLMETPQIINTTVEGQDGFGEMAEFKVEK